MSFYNSVQSKMFARRFKLVKSDTNDIKDKELSCVHPINTNKKSVFYDKKQNEISKRFTLVKKIK